jgi:type I restriction enzyme R subunit
MPISPPAAADEREWLTRKKRIDTRLASLGWKIVPFDAARPLSGYDFHALEEFPTSAGPADYALVVNGQLLGFIEAKKLTLGPQNVLSQAERYARGATTTGFDFHGLHVPFLYSTNGEVIWFHDVRHPLSRSRRIAQFHTPAALSELIARDFDGDCAKLLALPNEHPMLRPYQREANAAVEKAIADRKRQMLVAMATGTGKTFTTVNQVYRLMKSQVARRVLVLVDRKALAAQAVRAFASYEPEPGLKFNKIYEVYSQRFRHEDFGDDDKFDPSVLDGHYLENPKPGHAFVYVCTIQRMAINLFGREAAFEQGEDVADDDETDKLDIPIHAFDMVIADECHRGYTAAEQSVWRKTLDHFDAVKVGLTATPAAHTKAYFNDVVYRYDYQRAVREGHLVDYDAVTIRSGVRMNGVFLREGEQVRLIDPESGGASMDQLEDERQFDTADIERNITVPESNRRIVEELKKYCDEHQQRYGRFPKTLIFAANDINHVSHADRIVSICRDVFGRGDAFVQKITGSGTVDRPLQRIREFRNRPDPGIVVTVDMLSTGVDIPNLEFIVFLRPVKSRILFEQMLGRGTRKGTGACADKSHFTVFDCFDGTLLEYFRNASAFTDEPPEKPHRKLEEVIEDIWQNRDRAYNVKALVRRLQRINKEMSGDARDDFAAFVPDGDVGRFAQELPQKLSSSFTDTMKLLRNPAFQKLCLEYKRPRKTFIETIETGDDVTSQWLIRGADGREYKPDDYLLAFSKFVKENPEHIEAIRILLQRPRDWSTAALSELRQKLAANPLRFSVDNLQKAHQIRYHKALADVISMVKHAANETEPLLTAAERVKRAVEKVTANQSLTSDQRQWLDRIASHLVENLSVDRDDFDLIPALSHEGGWRAADKSFGGRLGELISDLNAAVAA